MLSRKAKKKKKTYLTCMMDDVKRKTDVITVYEADFCRFKASLIGSKVVLNNFNLTPNSVIVFKETDCTFIRTHLHLNVSQLHLMCIFLKQRQIWYAYLVIIQKWKVGIHMC